MCGIFAQIRRSSKLAPISLEEIEDSLRKIDEQLSDSAGGSIEQAAELARQADSQLSGLSGFSALAADPLAARNLSKLLAGAEAKLSELDLEGTGLHDSLWSLRHDRIATAASALEILGGENQQGWSEFQLGAALSVQTALSALDRLEVRGRDSAGISIILPNLNSTAASETLTSRQQDELFGNGSVRVGTSASAQGSTVSFTYKVASPIGKLGDNSAALRQAISADANLLQRLADLHEHAVVLGHTRWASIGEICEANAHPLDSGVPSTATDTRTGAPIVISAINGDVDNYLELKNRHRIAAPDGMTTDSLVVPRLISKMAAGETDPAEAFKAATDEFEGSAAMVACSLDDPHKLLLSVHGSGQALYIGLAEDSYIVASEPYGILEQTSSYVRLGETQNQHQNQNQTQNHNGHLNELRDVRAVELSAQHAGEVEPIKVLKPQGHSGFAQQDIITAEVTTRDVTRGEYPHYFAKEISQAPDSIRKTLQSQISAAAEFEQLIQSGEISKIVAIGQGTAAIAAIAFAEVCGQELAAVNSLGPLTDASAQSAPTPLPYVTAMTASELSGFTMSAEMSDHLIVAISQSGTTTDTNRTVSLLQARGAKVLAIVNRRNSDLSHQADFVFYTSDGRDIEMSVASTKAFYSQVVASNLVALQIADHFMSAQAEGSLAQQPWHQHRESKLAALQALPAALSQLLRQHDEIRRVARAVATQHRDVAVVGSGRNQIAAREVRIKLSELCYKSVSVDSVEDKKHIDLSAEPLIIVCAAGADGSNLDDIAKEIAIYCAHEATPVVFASENVDLSVPPEAHLITLPVAAPELGFVSSAMAGHLFSYEAALAVDALADPLRQTQLVVQQAIEAEAPAAESATEAEAVTKIAELWEATQPPVAELGQIYADALAAQRYDGYLGAGLAAELSSLYKYSGGLTNLSNYQPEFGAVGTPEEVWRRFLVALGAGIEALTRPIDAIRHQAKTVTVGITRADEALVSAPLVAATLKAGAPRQALSYQTLRELSALSLTVAEIIGHTRYLLADENISIASRSGISTQMKSEVETDFNLRGTKHRVATEQRVFLTTGRRDGKVVILVPEVVNADTTAITLLHVRLHARLAADTAVMALKGYRDRYEALWGAVTETEKVFDTSRLETIDVTELFTEPIVTLAEHWAAGGGN